MPRGRLRATARWSVAAAGCLAALAALATLTTRGAWAAAPPVSATLQPQQISLGEAAQLTITTSGNGMDAVTLPKVAGLEFRVVGQSRRMEIINGATLSTTSVIVRVVPQVAGIFSIPGITAQPLLLRVNPENGSGSSPYGTSNVPRRPPVVASGPTANGIKLTADGAAFVRMNLPKRDVYVGESIPVEIEVGMRAGMVTSVNGLPTLNNSDFTLNNLSHQPERVEKVIDGQHFTVLTWHSVLAPVKPGIFPLSVETPLTVRVRTRPQRDSSIDDLLGDPFMQNFFGATVPKDVRVSSQTDDLKVLPLPAEGRPSDFSGAVGSFKIASTVSAPHAVVGDPLTLRLRVSGAGNFDRVESPMLERLDRWKTYPPKSSFAPGDAVGYKGEKTFEQPLIASQPGSSDIATTDIQLFRSRCRGAMKLPAQILGRRDDFAASAAASASAPTRDASGGRRHARTWSIPQSPHCGRTMQPPATTRIVTDPAVFPAPVSGSCRRLLALLCAGGWAMRRRHSDSNPRRGRRQPPSSSKQGHSNASSTTWRSAAAAGQARVILCARARMGRCRMIWRRAGRYRLPGRHRSRRSQARLGAPGAHSADNADITNAAHIAEIFALADETNYAGRSNR